MIQYCLRMSVLLVACCLLPADGALGAGFPWKKYAKQSQDWYQSPDGERLIENVLSHQAPNGSWPKNIDTGAERFRGDPQKLSGTFDNGATRGELRFLARAYDVTQDKKCLAAFQRGLDAILNAQYGNGGWPQSREPGNGYGRYITFNDGAMIGILEFLRDIAESDGFEFVDAKRRARAGRAGEKGIDCILACQIVVNGERTAWCAQHDEVTLVPQKARSYEHPSISGGESAGICLFLMSIEDPSPQVINAVNAACRWYEKAQIRCTRVGRKDGDKVVLADSDASPLWARFYEIDTNRPIFSGRDGVIKYHLSEIEHERRNGYSWYVSSGERVLDAWPKWKSRNGSE